MAIETFLSADELGYDGARKKADMLVNEYGYRLVRIYHGRAYQAGALSTPEAKNYRLTEDSWIIEVDDGRPHYESIFKKTLTLP